MRTRIPSIGPPSTVNHPLISHGASPGGSWASIQKITPPASRDQLVGPAPVRGGGIPGVPALRLARRRLRAASVRGTDRLVAFSCTPRPRVNLILYNGALGTRAAWRTDVVRRTGTADAAEESRKPAQVEQDTRANRPGPTRDHRRGAELMRRGFGFDVPAARAAEAPDCGVSSDSATSLSPFGLVRRRALIRLVHSIIAVTLTVAAWTTPVLGQAPASDTAMLLVQPPGLSTQGLASYPLVVALHPNGSTSEALKTLLGEHLARRGRVVVALPRATIPAGSGFRWGSVEEAERLVVQAATNAETRVRVREHLLSCSASQTLPRSPVRLPSVTP